MPIQKLAKASAMAVGSELWIVPNPEASPWARKIDWYLNFQMARSTQHKKAQISEPLKDLIRENEIEFGYQIPATETLMVATQLRVPAAQVILVPYSSDKNIWIKSCKKIWEGLGHPRLRLFLPLEVNEQDIPKLWGDQKDSEGNPTELSFVPGDLPLGT